MTALEPMEALGEAEEEMLWPALSAPARRRPRRALRAALIAAAVLVLLALAALAASESGLLERYFPHSYDLIAEYVTHVEAVAENETLRLTLHEAVTDGYRTIVIYTVERLDGGTMEDWGPDMEISPRIGQGSPLLSGSQSNMTIEMETPNARTYLWNNSGSGQWELKGVSLRLLGLKNVLSGETLDAGSLKLEAELKKVPVRAAKRNAEASDRDLYVSIQLSPLSLRIQSYRNLAGMTPENAEPVQTGIIVDNGPSDIRVELLFRDGSRRDVSGEAYHHSERRSTGEITRIGDFWDLPDVSKVKAVVIDGREYLLTKDEAPAPRQGLAGKVSFLDSQRAWTFGSHEPAHPALTGEGGEVRISIDGIWTDGFTTELMLDIAAPQEEEYWQPVNEGGNLTFDARNKRGEALAVGVRSGGLVQGLLSLIVECADEAAQLTIGDGEAALVIPLDMKKLTKLPQIEPKEATPRQTAGTDEEDALRQALYDSLFEGRTPDATSYSADNGVYRLTVSYLYLAEEPGQIVLRALAQAAPLDGTPYEMRSEARRMFETRGLKDGEELRLSGGGSHQGGVIDGVRWFAIDDDYYYGDFSVAAVPGLGGAPTEGLDLETLDLDGLRLIWTPPEGGRITLDLPMTG